MHANKMPIRSKGTSKPDPAALQNLSEPLAYEAVLISPGVRPASGHTAPADPPAGADARRTARPSTAPHRGRAGATPAAPGPALWPASRCRAPAGADHEPGHSAKWPSVVAARWRPA